jgi:competence protein ComEA
MEKLLEQRRNALLVALAVVVVLVVGGRLLSRTGTPRQATPAAIAPLSPKRAHRLTIVVDVAGGVRRPGVYRFLAGARVVDAVARAGGAKPKALLSHLNLAERLADGEQVVVPLPGGQVAAVASAPESSGPVHLGSATVEQLDALPGVGPVTAQRIVDYRSEHGGFNSVAELDAVPGIGPARFAQLRELVAP